MIINIELEDAQARRAFGRLIANGSDLSPLLRDIGEGLLQSNRRRFDTATAPDGTPWAPLSPVTLARKKRNKDKILVQDGYLRDQLNYQLEGPHTLLVGSSRIYASTHQFGADRGQFGLTRRGAPVPPGDIPARPFLGLSTEDEREILEIVNDYLAGSITGI